MFKKQIGVIVAFGLLCAGIIIYSAVRVLGSAESFATSGYVHTSATENEDKKILFDSGTSYNKKSSDKISFYDSVGNNSKVDELNFIHYDDSSISSFVDGALVDLDDLSVDNVAMNHYALPKGIILEKRGNAYAVKDSATGYSFSNFIWKIDANKYLFISPSMKIHFSDADERGITNYCEVTYVGNSLIQVQTEDNIWQTISTDCKLFFDNGLYSDLYNKAILDDDNNVILDFARIIINSENNVELSPYVKSNGETTIPHFTVSSESGLDGYGGDPGTNGAPGASGSNGANGVDGAPGPIGADGTAGSGIDSEINDFPVFTIQNWKVTKNSVSGIIKIVEGIDTTAGEQSMLQNDDPSLGLYNKVFITDLETGEIILPNNINSLETVEAWKFKDNVDQVPGPLEFQFTPDDHGLSPDHSYMLQIDAVTKTTPESTPYERPYIIKTFWTDSAGFYGESYGSTIDTVSVNIVKEEELDTGSYPAVTCYLFYNYADASLADPDQVNNPDGYDILNDNSKVAGTFSSPSTEASTNFTFTENMSRNTKYYARFVYDISSTKKGITSQILELSTLKQRAYIGTPSLYANSNIYGFDITPGPLNDVDQSFVSYTYEFYEVDDDGNIISDKPIVVGPSSNLGTYSVAVGSSTDYNEVIKRGRKYRVKCVGTFYDNEKSYTITSDLSNKAMLEQSIKPAVYFQTLPADPIAVDDVRRGVYVNVPDPTSIKGFVIVEPGTDGYRLAVPNIYSAPTVDAPILTVNKDGYYRLSAPVYAVNETDFESEVLNPYALGKYFKALVSPDGTVKIRFSDPTAVGPSSDLAVVAGLQENSDYEISINGTLTLSDNSIVSTNNDVGNCYVHTAPASAMTAEWTINTASDEKLKEATVKLTRRSTSPDQETDDIYEYSFNSEKDSIEEITIDLFSGQINVAFLRDSSKYPKNKDEGLLSSVKIDPDVDTVAYNALFSEDGLKVDDAFFANGDVTVRNFADELAQTPSFTIYVKEAKDNSYTDYRNYQEVYNTIAKPDKNKVSGGYYYYENDFNYSNGLLVNYFNPGTKDQGACYITEEPDINRININSTEQIWTDLSHQERDIGGYKYDTYLMAGNYTNSIPTAYSISYYVYDSIDFYSADSFSVVNNVEDPKNPGSFIDMISYQRQSEVTPQLYYYNKDMSSFLGASPDDSIALNYLTPVHLEDLELAKVTIEVDGDPSMPKARFIAMTKEEYARRNNITVAQVPTVEDDVRLFYIDSLISDDALNGNPHLTEDDVQSHGHQFVFAWTVNVKFSDKELVFPFDSKVQGQNGLAYSEYALTPTARFDSMFANSPYVAANPSSVYGKDAYMFIPHSTHQMLNGESDVPRISPTINSVTWDVDGDKAIVRTIVYDNDKIIERLPSDPNSKLAYVNEFNSGSGSAFGFKRLVDENLNTITISITDDDAYLNDSTCFATLMNDDVDSTIVNSIPITDADDDGLVSAAVVAYKYSDRYTNLGDKLFNEYPKYVEYIGVNWAMKNSYNENNLSLFSNLFETATYSNEKIQATGTQEAKPTDISLHTFGSMKAYVYWLLNSDDSSDTGLVNVQIPISDMEYIAGFRLKFENTGEDHSLQLDKLLPSFDMFNNEGGADVTTFDYSSHPGFVDVRFKFVVPTELQANIKYPDTNNSGTVKTVDMNGNDVEVKYSSFQKERLNSTPVKVTVTPLIRSGKGGYKYLAKTLTKSSQSIYSYETFGLKVLPDNTKTLISTDFDIHNYYPLYYTFGDTFNYFDGQFHYSTYGHYYPYLGSFYNMRLVSPTPASDARLYVASTRFYFNSSNSYTKNYQLSTGVTNDDKESFTKYIPSLITEGSAMELRTYDKGIYPFINYEAEIDNYRGSTAGHDNERGTIIIPGGTPTVEYSDDDKTYESSYFYATHTSRDAKIYYSVVHKDTIEKYYAPGNLVSFYKISNYNGPSDFSNEDYRFQIEYDKDASGNYIKDAKGARIPSIKYYDLTTYRSTETEPFNDVNLAPLSDYLIPATDIGGDNIDRIGIYNLMPSSEYKVVAWRYVADGANPGTYHFIPDRMFLSGIEKDNYHIIQTSQIAELSRVVDYESYSLTQKRLKVTFKDIRVEDVKIDYNQSDYYLVLRLLNKDGSFITFLDYGHYPFGQVFEYDLDNIKDDIGSADPDRYVTNWNDLSIPRNNTSIMSNIMKYGLEYRVQIHVYENDRGPMANSTWNPNYDFDLDEDCMFVNVEAGIKNNKADLFKVNNDVDKIDNITVSKITNTSDVSYFVFNIGAVSLNSTSGTLKGHSNQPMITPFIILEHNGGYYDISGYAGSQVIAPNSSIKIPTTAAVTETDGEGHTITVYKDIYQEGDTIRIYLFGRQEIALSNPSSGPVSQTWITANAGYQNNPNVNEIMGTRGVLPSTGTPVVDLENHVAGTPISGASVSALAQIIDSSGKSKLLTSATKTTESSIVSVGTVGILALDDFMISYRNASSIEMVKKISISMVINTKYIISAGSISTGTESYPYSIHTVSVSPSRKSGLLNLGDYWSGIFNTAKQGFTHDSEEVTSVVYTIQFLDENDQLVQIDSSSSTSGQTVNDLGTTLTYVDTSMAN